MSSKKLTSEGKIPHDVELQSHPEKSMEGKSWLMGDVSALIKVSRVELLADNKADNKDVQPAQQIVDDMIKQAKECIDAGSRTLGGSKAKL